MKTLKIEPENRETQGDFVEINAEDYNPAIHTLIAGEVGPDIVGNAEPVPVDETAIAKGIRLCVQASDYMMSLSPEDQQVVGDHMNDLAKARYEAANPPVVEPPAKETKAQKAARLAQEAADAAADAAPPETPADPAPAPAPGWGTPAAT